MHHYVYVDWTTDEAAYPFYVGQGARRRISKKYRNMFHRRLALKHGLHREVVLGPVTREEALAEEVRLIAELRTFHGDNPRGANFTRGGEGAPGHAVVMTDEWRAKIAASLSGRRSEPEANLKRSVAQLGKKKPRRKQFTQEERDRIYGPRRGHDHVSQEKRRSMADKLIGKKRAPFTDEHRQKLREAALRPRGPCGGR